MLCPSCGQYDATGAVNCPACGEEFPEGEVGGDNASACPVCGHPTTNGVCPACGETLAASPSEQDTETPTWDFKGALRWNIACIVAVVAAALAFHLAPDEHQVRIKYAILWTCASAGCTGFLLMTMGYVCVLFSDDWRVGNRASRALMKWGAGLGIIAFALGMLAGLLWEIG